MAHNITRGHGGVLGDGEDFLRVAFARVPVRAPAAFAHAAEIHRGDLEIVGEERCNMGEPAGMRAVAMHENNAGLGRFALCRGTPEQVVDRGAVHGHIAALMRGGEGASVPERTVRDLDERLFQGGVLGRAFGLVLVLGALFIGHGTYVLFAIPAARSQPWGTHS